MSMPRNEMPPEELREYGRAVADWVAEFLASVEERPVLARVRPGEVKDALPGSPPASGETMDAILADFERIIVPGLTHWNHPGFRAWFASTGSGPGILAETLCAALNNNAMVWRSGPAATELEGLVCDWLRQMTGLPGGFEGHIEDTASLSSITALAAARHRATGGAVREKGLGACPPMRVYCSAESHMSIDRAAILLGLGQEGCRKIEVDEAYRMRPDALERAIAEDRAAGILPMAIVATVGTTSTTSIDPVGAIAQISRREGIWLHVDAAYGGSMAVSPRHRDVLDGAGEADSIVINPHKWLFVPMDCSVLFCRDMPSIRETLSLVPPYLMTPENRTARQLMDYGPALGRRFRALKLWFAFRWFGHDGLAALIDQHVDLAQEFAGWVEAEPAWEVVAPHPMSVVLFRHCPPGVEDLQALNERIMHGVNDRGRSMISQTVVNRPGGGIWALRCAVGNSRTERRHLEQLWKDLREVAGAVR
jgi:aromatic-L-amino-acid decarboxylase